MKINEYINENNPKSIRFNTEDSGTLIGLPYPYTVPCVEGSFQEMFYWDTYFTNKGYIATGNIEQAKNNAENMFYLINKYGFMPNGSRTGFLNRSQPPFLSLMVRDIYDCTGDKIWLKKAYSALTAEHHFWTDKRLAKNGLNFYSGDTIDPETDCSESVKYLCSRIGFKPEEDELLLAQGCRAGCESGWDMTPRMTYLTHQYNAVDLNCLLYSLEKNLEYFAGELSQLDDQSIWRTTALKRATLCREYLLEDGVFYDYNFLNNSKSLLKSVANFYPLYCGMASKEEASKTRELLNELETDYGILTCEKNDIKGVYQWDYPNGWAPMQLIVAGGLMNYGYTDDALRIARKFKETVERCFDETGHLWEKYNIVNGTTEAKNEYAMPAMMGWTFGVYALFCSWLGENI